MGLRIGIVVLAGAVALPARSAASPRRLDLDIYVAPSVTRNVPDRRAAQAYDGWRPGDPRDLRGEGPWVRRLSHVGYAGLGIGGLLASVATGGVAPAVGFGIVALIQLFRLWGETSADTSGGGLAPTVPGRP